MNKSGIYIIKNILNGDCYIGSSININTRLLAHKSMLLRGSHQNIHLQRAWELYGSNSFIFAVVCYTNVDELINKEQYYIDTFNSVYNICKKADRSIMSESTRLKIIESLKGRFILETPPFKGKKHTDVSKQKIRNNHANFKGINHPQYGTKVSQKVKDKISASLSGEKHPFYNKKRPEHGLKISGESHYLYGKKVPEKSILKLSESKSALTKEKLIHAISMRKNGDSYAKIGNFFNCSSSAIERSIKAQTKISKFYHAEIILEQKSPSKGLQGSSIDN